VSALFCFLASAAPKATKSSFDKFCEIFAQVTAKKLRKLRQKNYASYGKKFTQVTAKKITQVTAKKGFIKSTPGPEGSAAPFSSRRGQTFAPWRTQG
jgi:hypothetical protein